MDTKNIPLIILNFNQLTYLKNLINWFRWYHPENPIFILDNASTYAPLHDYYKSLFSLFQGDKNIWVHLFMENKAAENLKSFLKDAVNDFDYYIISDPDIMPHPNTPVNFLQVFKNMIDNRGFHHVGFNLIIDDLPKNLHERAMIIDNEKSLLNNPVVEYDGFIGYKAPIDTTFSLYRNDNGGWTAPMDGAAWNNSLRLFNAFHLGWYIDPENVNAEMDNYFKTGKYRDLGPVSAGKNNNRPKQYIENKL